MSATVRAEWKDEGDTLHLEAWCPEDKTETVVQFGNLRAAGYPTHAGFDADAIWRGSEEQFCAQAERQGCAHVDTEDVKAARHEAAKP